MPEFKTTNASDNPDHEDVEKKRQAQRDRDQAEIDRQNAKVGASAGRTTTAEERAAEAQQGRGPAGLNKGPSDTSSADPHRPAGYPQPGDPTGGLANTSGGTGQSPPTRPAPNSDKPEDERLSPERQRANQTGRDEDKVLADKIDADRKEARQAEQDAKDRIGAAEGEIAKNQSKPAPERDGDKG